VATSDIEIANRALQKLGAARISAFDQDHPNARSVSAAYPHVRDDLLRSYPWSFAIKRASLPALAAKTLFGGLNRYPLPDDFLRLLVEDGSGERKDWIIEGREIVTRDSAPLNIRYVARVTDPTLFAPDFVEAFATKLAMELTYEITQSDQKFQILQQEFLRSIVQARSAGAFELPPVDSAEDDWLLARL